MNRATARDERGAVALVTGVVMAAVLMAIAAFAVDLGSQRVLRRDMQALADVVALDLGRLVDGRTRQQILDGYGDKVPLADALAASVANNDITTLGTTDSVEAFLVRLDEAGAYTTIGDGTPSPVLDDQVPDAVVVIAGGTVGFAFGLAASGSATREAIARAAEPTICFSLGTTALALDSSESVLGPALDSILRVNLSAVGHEGLVDVKEASVPVADLMVRLNVGSVSQLASTDVSLQELLIVTAAVLRANADAASATLLENLTIGVSNASLNLGEIFAVQAGENPQALSADVNVLELITAAAVAANGNNAIALDVPGVAEVRIIEPPVIACGAEGVQARSAQVRFSLDTNLGTVPPAAGEVLVAVDVHVGEGRATLDTLSCLPPSADFTIETGVVSTPPLEGGQATLRTTFDVTVLGIPLAGVNVTVDLEGQVVRLTEAHHVVFPPAPDLLGPVLVPSHGVGSTLNLAVDEIHASASLLGLGITTADLLAALTPLVEELVDTVDDLLTPLLNQLTDALGIRLGVAELQPTTRPVCDRVMLVG